MNPVTRVTPYNPDGPDGPDEPVHLPDVSYSICAYSLLWEVLSEYIALIIL